MLLALLANAVWAFNFIAGKAGVIQFQPFLFTALRFAVLLRVLLPFLRWMPGRMRANVPVSQGISPPRPWSSPPIPTRCC